MRIYRNDHEVKGEKCNFGCSHHVVYNEIADVTEALRVKKDTFYGPTPTGIGYDVFYRDYFGNLYLREGTCDGLSSVLVDTNDDFWMMRPYGFDANKTLDGRIIDREGNPVE